ncbi:hypothetical protein D9M70_586820 [compost metagenome]
MVSSIWAGLGWAEQPVEQIFHPCATEAVKLVDGNYLYVRQQVGGVLVSASDAGFHFAAS